MKKKQVFERWAIYSGHFAQTTTAGLTTVKRTKKNTVEAPKEKCNMEMSQHAALFVYALSALVIILISAMDVDATLALNYGSQKAKEYWESQGRADAVSKLTT